MINFENKNILFYRPAKKDNEPNINDYDYVIITNNQINLFFDKFKDIKTKILFFSNGFFTDNNIDSIKKNKDNIDYFFVCKVSLVKFKENIDKIPIVLDNTIKGFKKTPLGLTKFLNYLNDKKFNILYITGVDFYKDEKKMYEDGYELLRSHKKSHDIEENINYFNKFKQKHKIKFI